MGGLGDRVRGLSGWRRHLLAVALGMCAAAAMPPVHAVPLLVPAFTGLIWLSEGARRIRGAFGVGWSFGFGFFAAGLYWIAIAFVTDPRHPDWAGPFAVLGLSACLALYSGFAAAAIRAAGRGGWRAAVLLGVVWTGLEWVRGWAFTGFPWNPMGSVWSFSDAMIQSAAWMGTSGLGLVTVIAAAAPVVLDGGSERRRWGAVAAAFAVLGLLWGAGALRLADADGASVPDVRLRLVQPNIPQELKWVSELRHDHVLRQIAMSREAADPPPTHVIWAETMVPFLLSRSPKVRLAVARAAPEGGLVIVGAPRTTPERQDAFHLWNSLQAIDGDGRVVGTYDKHHLVPFGEYVPLRGVLPIDKLVAGASDFSPGPGARTLRLPGLPPVGPLICYEVIFPGRVIDPDDRPDWLLNLTNDSWYGRSSGPYQHFAATRLRAVEEGLPLVRVANGGISGVVDAYGRVRASLGLGRSAVLDVSLPVALSVPGPYARFGDGIVLPFMFALVAWAFFPPGKRK